MPHTINTSMEHLRTVANYKARVGFTFSLVWLPSVRPGWEQVLAGGLAVAVCVTCPFHHHPPEGMSCFILVDIMRSFFVVVVV